MKCLVALMIVFGLAHCQGRGKPVVQQDQLSTVHTARDTTITPDNAFTQLTIDSLFMERFVHEQALKERIADQLRQFYNNRNYQYAWFTEEGLAEHTPAFWNRLSRYITIANDSALYNEPLFTQMQYLIAGDTMADMDNARTASRQTL